MKRGCCLSGRKGLPAVPLAPLAAVPGTQPSKAISWHPLQMPRLKVSGLQGTLGASNSA